MNIHAMLRLQGLNPCNIIATTTNHELGKFIGNSMSVNVLEQIMRAVIHATTLLSLTKDNIPDRWNTHEAVTLLCESKGRTFAFRAEF